MLIEALILLLALIGIVLAAELFTNGIEWLGQRLNLSEGVVGSILAAVGTALPETLIPIVAILFFGHKDGAEVGIGAIAGAPFMLSTLTLAICGMSVLGFAKAGIRSPELAINSKLLVRDLNFFLVAFSLALFATFVSSYVHVRFMIAIVLVSIYPYYVFKTFQHAGEVGEEPEHLHLERIFKTGDPNRLRLIIPQVLLGSLGIIGGAFVFVDHIDDLSNYLGISPTILSLIITPVATELPEKINSVLWSRKGKDTLALSNITGALVFQSCFPVAFGVATTEWILQPGTICTCAMALISAFIYCRLIDAGKLKAAHLTCGFIAYAIAISLLLYLAPVHRAHSVIVR